MDATKQENLKNIGGAFARWLLHGLGVWLVSRGIITTAQGDLLVTNLTPVFIGAIPSLTAFVWAAWQKVHANRKTDFAITVPTETTREQLEQAFKGKNAIS